MFHLHTPLAIVLGAAVSLSAHAGSATQSMKLLPDDGAAANAFGSSVDIAGGIIAVGSPHDGEAGSVHLFSAQSGAQLRKLIASDGAAGDQFGASVAVSNGIIVVGAPGHDHSGSDSGAVYLFDAGTGAELHQLTPADPDAGDEFGHAVAIDQGVVAVSAWRADEFGDASGAAYLFDAASGTQLDKLLPTSGNANQSFGVSIALDDGLVAVGARTYFVLSEGYTFAKVHLFDVANGDHVRTLQPDIENYNGDLGGHFGASIDMNDGVVAVGTPYRSVFFDFSGAAYLFDASTGDQLHFIYPADGHDRDHFGASVALDNGVCAIGANEDDDAAWAAGSAYLFDVASGMQTGKVLAGDGDEFDDFGSAIAMSNDVVVVGATGDDDNGENSGSVYLFGDGISVCPEDLDHSGAVDFGDLLTLLAAWGDTAGDLNGDGTTDFTDLVQLLAAWGAC